MSVLAAAVLALSLSTAPLALSESLHVVAEDSVLAEEISRAARRYMRNVAEPATENAQGAAKADLTVRQEPGSARGQRWLLILSAGPTRTVRRTLELHEVPSRFDLAEAVAIGLPDMMARLAEIPTAPTTHIIAQPATTATSTPAPIVTRSRPTLAMLTRSAPQKVESEAQKEPREPREIEPEAQSKPALVPQPPPVQPPATETKEEVKKPEQPALRLVPQKTIALEIPQQPPQPARTPPAALALVGSGAVVLLAGIATGAAAQLVARQVDSPAQMRFDADLDRRGKALDTATIVLDTVGGAVLASGGVWLLTRAIKARREAAKISISPAGAGVVLQGSF